MKKRIYLIELLVISIVAFAGVMIAINNKSHKVDYRTYTIKKTPDLILTGKVTPTKQVEIAKKLPAGTSLVYDSISNNSFVRKGECVAMYTYKHVDPSSSLKIQQLVNERKGLIGDNSVDNQIKINQLNQQIDSIAKKIYAHEYLAPFDGYIQIEPTDKEGVSLVSASQVIKTGISQYDLPTISHNSSVKLLEEATGKQAKGQIDYISVLPETGSSNYSILLRTKQHLNYGNSIEIKLPVNQILIPAKAVDHGAVYVMNHGKPQKVKYAVEKQNNDWILKPGATVKIGDKLLLNYKELPKNER
ncbi:hypothetical protein EQU27_04085 [Fructilactobacillus sanfranciscensis]|uniref:hypothetical protein n=1 Tax=Fructilactobacillus sanfranciscensis TaxID=1625 RepID=UPI001EF1071E|nr:hypothetical protein [Fructilactobacillus sanfranciscensis]MCG7195898.1 hypothetical protein [Fructilactobacillus sanfranciscensis]